jgi:hypothetical protein
VNEYEDTKKRFERETAKHEMTILHDDGQYRHLRFMQPKTGSSCYWFDLITVPHALIFRGDGESFVFSRTEDMFEFFRSGIYRDGSIHINPDYWAEKLTSNRDAATTFSEERFGTLVAEQLAGAEAEYPGVTAEWAKQTASDLAEYNLEYEEEAFRALYEFYFGQHVKVTCTCGDSEKNDYLSRLHAWEVQHKKLPGKHEIKVDHVGGFSFQDIEARQAQDYDWWFLWACYGICWGIARYDAARKQVAA